ncbi:Clp protease N-terminal domain-containing protein [Micromonospora sp. NPDC048842]|uniref:Clp protease N-terminal domain-containing protein n=1 Tax=Micromonospora sp. NPDC048842 TaxID=3154346 RepID=UPI0033E666BC
MSVTIGGGLYAVLRRAADEAARLKQVSIGSDDLLFALLGRYPRLRPAVPVRAQPREPAASDATDDVFGLSVEVTFELVRAQREAYWRSFGWPGPAVDRLARAVGWELEAESVLRMAAQLALHRQARWVGSDHLLETLLEGPGDRAQRYVDLDRLIPGRLDDAVAQIWPRGDQEPPWLGLAAPLRQLGVLTGPGAGAVRSGRLATRLISSASRLFSQTTPALGWLELEAVAETVRVGHDRTSPAHLILAVLVLEEEMRAGELRPAGPSGSGNEALLDHVGLTRQEAGLVVAAARYGGEFAGPRPKRAWRTDRTNPPWTVAAARIAERARELSTLGARLPAGSIHLLHAALTDPDEEARRLLTELGVDPSVVRDLAARRLGLVQP